MRLSHRTFVTWANARYPFKVILRDETDKLEAMLWLKDEFGPCPEPCAIKGKVYFDTDETLKWCWLPVSSARKIFLFLDENDAVLARLRLS